jgi:hypothetical protein
MELKSPFIRGEMIEANEFYDLAMRYNVSSVPQITIKDSQGLGFGAVSKKTLLKEIMLLCNQEYLVKRYGQSDQNL